MRLFQTGEFYLHDSSRLAAEWLNDRDTLQYFRNTGMLLSTVIQMHTMERDMKLYVPDFSVMEDCRDVTTWASASAHNIAWLIDYYECLSIKCSRLFTYKPLNWEFKALLHSYTAKFDDCYTDARLWLPMTTSEARSSYAASVKLYSYRKVKPPFWYPIPSGRQRQATELPAYDLSPLDLDGLGDPSTLVD